MFPMADASPYRPEKEDFTRKEWALIQRNRTPFQVQRYLNSLPYNRRKPATMRSFRGVVRTGTAHCLEAALSAGVILEQHGYPVLFLDLESWDGLDHILFLYKKDGKWGTVARSRDPGLHGRKPVFKRLTDLVDSYFDPFIDRTGRIIGYGTGTLEELGGYNWRLSKSNVWRVERYFIDMPHRKFPSSNKRYEYWHKRFLAYKKRYPDRRPYYFNGREKWWPGYKKFW
jgi:hypothetical protein